MKRMDRLDFLALPLSRNTRLLMLGVAGGLLAWIALQHL